MKKHINYFILISRDIINSIKSIKNKYFLALILIFLANAPFWIVSASHYINRPIFSFDSILSILVMTLNLELGVVSLIISWFCDLLINFFHTFRFLSFYDYLLSIKFASNINFINFLTIEMLFLFSIFLIAIVFIIRLSNKKNKTTVPLLLFLFIIAITDSLNGSFLITKAQTKKTQINFIGSSAYTVFSSVKDEFFTPISEIKKINDGGLEELKKIQGNPFASKKSFIYIIVESFGYPTNKDLNDWLINKFSKSILIDRYKIRDLKLYSNGATTNGEMRRLCSLEGSYRKINSTNSTECLPQLFKKNGMSTNGFHGFYKSMFDRDKWWTTIGIENQYFLDSENISEKKLCGSAFRGLCDDYLLDKAFFVAEKPNQFVYVLTLNSHLPLVKVDVPDDLAKICADNKIDQDTCVFSAHLGGTLDSIVNHLIKSKSTFEIFISGDHSPPFSSVISRNNFQSHHVMGFSLIPKQ